MPTKWARGAPDKVNQAVWSESNEVARFTSANGWIDASERRLIEQVAAERPGARVLDIGVGGGRTVPLLTPWAGSYVGIDFVPEMVEATRRRFTDFDVRGGDARKLEFADDAFDVVVFTINGIDSISHADRATALTEIRRVLNADGVFIFSTHNFDGPGRADRPWRLPPMTLRQPRSSARNLARRATHERRALINFRTLHPLGELGANWAVDTSGAHDFGILVHYVTYGRLIEELRDAGFEGEVAVMEDRAGVPVDPSSTERHWYFNIVANCSRVVSER